MATPIGGLVVKRRSPGVSVLRLEYPADEGTQDVWFGQARVVVKTPSDPHTPSKLVANEFICARLALAIGVPVPMGDAGLIDGDRLAWVSAQVEYDGQVFPPADLTRAAEERPSDVAAMVAFDVWVDNDDRHDGNVIYDPEVGLWAIDFERSLGAEVAGTPGYFEAHRDNAPRIWALDGVEISTSYFSPWAQRIMSFPSSGLRGTLDEARNRGLLTKPEATEIRRLLEYRQTRIRYLLNKSMNWSTKNSGEGDQWLTMPEPGTS